MYIADGNWFVTIRSCAASVMVMVMVMVMVLAGQ